MKFKLMLGHLYSAGFLAAVLSFFALGNAVAQSPPARELPSSFTQGSLTFSESQQIQPAPPINYWLVKPPGYDDSDQSVPLVLFLHGGGEGGDDLDRVLKHGPPKMAAAGKKFEFLLVAPQNPSMLQHWDDQRLMQLVYKIEAEERIDPDRIYLAGLSRGAYGVWRLAIQNPSKFAAMIAVCGGGDAPYVKRLKDMPIWVFHGAKDDVIPIGESQQMVDGLKAVGANVKFTIYPDAKHDSWTETYENDEVYRWLLNQRRTASER